MALSPVALDRLRKMDSIMINACKVLGLAGVVVERENSESLLELAATKVAEVNKRIEGIRRNEALRPVWLDKALRAAGVLKKGETL